MIKLPLTVSTKSEARELRSAILHHLGDWVYSNCPEQYNELAVPEPLASSNAIGTPTKSRRSTFGSVLSFRNERSFATLNLRYEPEDENRISYRLSAHAGWSKGGTEEHIKNHHEAFDTILERLGVLPDAYRFTCPCGDEEIIVGGYSDVSEYISKHNEEDHTERRISTTTLLNREVTIYESEEHAHTPATQTENQDRRAHN